MSQSNRRPEASNYNSPHAEAVSLLKEGIKGKIPSSKISELRRKYNDNMVDQIQEAFYDILNNTEKRAKKFMKLIDKKYRNKGMPLHIVLKEADKYRVKKNLSELEFAEFKKQYEKMMNQRVPQYEQQSLVPNTTMAQLFGDIYSTDGLVVKDSDYEVVQQIINLYNATRTTHSSIILQSIQYQGFDKEVLDAVYDSTRHDINNAVNPVIAAMFVPKIPVFEFHFLYTNIAYIVKCRYKKEPIRNQQDLMLLHYMIIDSTDVVCSADTPLKDLRLRANLQNNLWNCVLNMRNGRFFESTSTDFFNAIDSCKISSYDAPDLPYIGDESIILRRLLSSMSFNSLLLNTEPIFGVGGNPNPANFPVIHNRVITRPLIHVRLGNTDEPVQLENTVNNIQYFVERGVLVSKNQRMIATRGVLIFHVQRRSVSPNDNYQYLMNPLPHFTHVPAHILINERLNASPIEYKPMIPIDGKIFSFVSGVILENPLNIEHDDDDVEMKHRIIIGTGAIIRLFDSASSSFTNEYQCYTPKLLPLLTSSTAGSNTKPVWDKLSSGSGDDSAEALLAKKASILIYRDLSYVNN